MATASKVQLSLTATDLPEYCRRGISQEQANKASELLQENHEKHHIFFRDAGLHNHIVHHILAIWALNASPDALQQGYDTNKLYQRSQPPVERSTLEDLHDPSKFVSYLGNQKHYHTFLEFFQSEIEKDGWQDVLQKYLFAGDERADKMFVRMYAGFLHPIIHLGYGIEFKQPAIIAEALAQAACHDDWIGKLLLPAENAAKNNQQSKSIVELLDAIHTDKELKNAARWEDGNKIRDGILVRAGQAMIDHASRFHVKPDELEYKTAEMTNAVCLYTAGAQHPPNMVMYDFYFM